MRVYLTGTDTDVGKTVTAAVLCRAWGLDYVKPVQSGLDGGTDTWTVQRLAPDVRTWPETWRLTRPASPHASAAEEGVRIDPTRVVLPPAERLLVEGAGGWMVPLAMDPLVWQADLVRHLDLPVLVVARTGLGTLNHTCLTVRAIQADGLTVQGLILVGPPHPDNERDLPRLTGVPVVVRLPWVDDVAAAMAELTHAVRSATGSVD